MIDMMILAGLLAVLLGVLYAVYLIPPVKRVVRKLARRYREILFTVGFALFAAAVMYFIVLSGM